MLTRARLAEMRGAAATRGAQVALVDEVIALQDVLVKHREFVQAVKEFRTEDGDLPLGVCDYYGMDDLLGEADAHLPEDMEAENG